MQTVHITSNMVNGTPVESNIDGFRNRVFGTVEVAHTRVSMLRVNVQMEDGTKITAEFPSRDALQAAFDALLKGMDTYFESANDAAREAVRIDDDLTSH